jgi:hypothetical protein
MNHHLNALPVDAEMQHCIGACSGCHDICVATAQRCLELGGDHAAPEHLGLLLDCAQICATSADFMLRGSRFHGLTCGACAEICAACAEACAAMGEDEVMRACADACRRCAESCRTMAHGGAHGAA